jgi:hypothetical protein
MKKWWEDYLILLVFLRNVDEVKKRSRIHSKCRNNNGSQKISFGKILILRKLFLYLRHERVKE